MQIFLVGGAVRDRLLGRPCGDRDWVVVGATPQELLALGFRPVGDDFPVFLHPISNEEYALARTERKTGRGYSGFAFHAAPDVSLEEDLARRDLTINAMAQDESGQLIDPWGGQRDLQARLLRHVSPAFVEDPVRILRLARFAARLHDFSVAPSTMALMREMVRNGEVDHLVPERVWQEIARGLMEARPSKMLAVLRECGAWARLLPSLAAWDAEAGSSGLSRGPGRSDSCRDHWLDRAADQGLTLSQRFALLCTPPPGGRASHGGQGGSDRPKAQAPLPWQDPQHLRAPRECTDLAAMWARERDVLAGANTLDAPGMLALMQACDAWRKPQRFAQLIGVAEIWAGGEDGVLPAPVQAGLQRLRLALACVSQLDLHQVSAQAQAQGARAQAIGAAIQAARLQALGQLLA